MYGEINLWNITISDEIIQVGIRIGAIILVLMIAKFFGQRVINKLVRKAITPDKYSSPEAEQKRENTIIAIFSAILRTTIWTFGPILIIAQLGVNIGPLIAGASILGVAIGFGSQKIVQDFVSGILIIVENQYRIGDIIEVNNVVGTVENITMRQTILRDYKGRKHYVNNGQISHATNYTVDYANLILNMDIAYDADIKQVETVINEVGEKIAQDKQFKAHITEAPKFLRIQEFGANSVVVRIKGQVKPGLQWQIAGELRLRLKQAFDKNKIEIPYNQLVIHKADK